VRGNFCKTHFTSACFAPNYCPHIYSAAFKIVRPLSASLRCITRSQSRGRLPFESCQSQFIGIPNESCATPENVLRASCRGAKNCCAATVLSLPSVIRAASNACVPLGDYFSARTYAQIHRPGRNFADFITGCALMGCWRQSPLLTIECYAL
jgi:hypothetical protein